MFFQRFSSPCPPHTNAWHTNCLTEVRKEKVMGIKKNIKRGFTLIELLVVIAITSAAAVLIPAVQSFR
jgi:prepilin-type N-terminal cleavage/methylation domain-containing protein